MGRRRSGLEPDSESVSKLHTRSYRPVPSFHHRDRIVLNLPSNVTGKALSVLMIAQAVIHEANGGCPDGIPKPHGYIRASRLIHGQFVLRNIS